MVEEVDGPSHYGGKENPYEAIKIIEAWNLGFNLGNAVKYILRAGRKGNRVTDLKKSIWFSSCPCISRRALASRLLRGSSQCVHEVQS